MISSVYFVILFKFVHSFLGLTDIDSSKMRSLPKNLPSAILDIAVSLPSNSITIVSGNSTEISQEHIFELICLLNGKNIQVVNFDLTLPMYKDKYYSYLTTGLDTSEPRTSLIFCEPYECEAIVTEVTNLVDTVHIVLSNNLHKNNYTFVLTETGCLTCGVYWDVWSMNHTKLTNNNFIHRSILYIFFWPHGEITDNFLAAIKEAMRVAVITNPRRSVFRVYYNQATPKVSKKLTLVNWWSGSLYKSPVLPPADKVYQDFQGRVFEVPVLHAPPWHFVKYSNDSGTIEVTGGRDDTLLALMAKTLNFKYRYYDPPERSQGSSISGNATFRGTLGLIWKRKADFFVGDVTISWERLQAVEFSFFTLADSGAFLTHAPDKLSETIAIIRPFRWEVWPFVCVTLLVTGPALWVIVAAPSLWLRRNQNQQRLFNNCCWFTTTLFLRQSSTKEPSSTHKARLVSVLISLGATYVIGDMYSANLTSLLARPAKEKPIGTLQALEEAMRYRDYELVVERHSSSLSILQNGTGVYGRLARLMRRQRIQRVRSIEVGVRMVLARRRVAILGGRETLYYDTERFGSHNFHLSEKLYTRYSAIALQIGCPYLEPFNKVVMNLFEAGILSKITSDEYKNLPERSRRSEPVTESENLEKNDVAEGTPNKIAMQPESTIGLEPVSLTMMRGAFCLLGIGYCLAGLILAIEIRIIKHRKTKAKIQIRHNKTINVWNIRKIFNDIKATACAVIDQALRSD